MTTNDLGIADEDPVTAGHFLEIREKLAAGEKLTVCFDIDGVIATKTAVNDYSKAEPILQNIECLNKLYEMGHTIILFTARGTVTGIDWREVTAAQLKKWGVCYSELKFGKPAADIYVDDRFMEMSKLKTISNMLSLKDEQ